MHAIDKPYAIVSAVCGAPVLSAICLFCFKMIFFVFPSSLVASLSNRQYCVSRWLPCYSSCVAAIINNINNNNNNSKFYSTVVALPSAVILVLVCL